MNIILIGPVSDNVERAKRVFALAEKLLTKAGHTVVHNPMRDHVAGLTEAQYMARSLTAICELKDKHSSDLNFFALPVWQLSKGAFCEIALCEKLNLKMIDGETRKMILTECDYERMKQSKGGDS